MRNPQRVSNTRTWLFMYTCIFQIIRKFTVRFLNNLHSDAEKIFLAIMSLKSICQILNLIFDD